MKDTAVKTTSVETQERETSIKSVRKAMAILDFLCEARRPLRVSEISAKLNMSPSAVSRLIATLSRGSLVHQDEETGRCYLGLGLTVLGSNALGRRSLDRIAIPVMDELANRTRGYISLARLCRGKAVFMRAMPKPLSQHDLHICIVAPFHACAPGKILASALEASGLRELIATYGMDPITTNTITDPDSFAAEVEFARTNGFAIDDGESAFNHRHVACPIFDHDGNVAATLSAGGPISDFPWDEIRSLVQSLSHGCVRISRELGYLGEPRVNLDALDEKRPQLTSIATDISRPRQRPRTA